MMTTITKKRRKYKLNKVKFARFIGCCILAIWLTMNIINMINNSTIEFDSTLESATFNNIEDAIITSVYAASIETESEYKVENECKIDYSNKPEKLDNLYYDWMIEISKQEDVPLAVILAIITNENSLYNPNAINDYSNGTMDIGLGQINSTYVNHYAEIYNIEHLDPYDAHDSILFVARHMKYLSNYAINKYNLSEMDSYIFAAGAYNRGLSNECKYRNMYSYKEAFIKNYNKFI